jgi:hypothetical protein
VRSPWWWTSTRLHGATTQKTAIFILTAVRTSNPTYVRCVLLRAYYFLFPKWVSFEAVARPKGRTLILLLLLFMYVFIFKLCNRESVHEPVSLHSSFWKIHLMLMKCYVKKCATLRMAVFIVPRWSGCHLNAFEMTVISFEPYQYYYKYYYYYFYGLLISFDTTTSAGNQ